MASAEGRMSKYTHAELHLWHTRTRDQVVVLHRQLMGRRSSQINYIMQRLCSPNRIAV